MMALFCSHSSKSLALQRASRTRPGFLLHSIQHSAFCLLHSSLSLHNRHPHLITIRANLRHVHRLPEEGEGVEGAGDFGAHGVADLPGALRKVVDEEGDFAIRCNAQMVGLEKVDSEEAEQLRLLIKRHADFTKSQKAFKVLALWEEMAPKFVKVMPKDYKRVLQALRKAEQDGLSGDDALNAAFEANARDVSRIGGG